jgi:hypothetical protein
MELIVVVICFTVDHGDKTNMVMASSLNLFSKLINSRVLKVNAFVFTIYIIFHPCSQDYDWYQVRAPKGRLQPCPQIPDQGGSV